MAKQFGSLDHRNHCVGRCRIGNGQHAVCATGTGSRIAVAPHVDNGCSTSHTNESEEIIMVDKALGVFIAIVGLAALAVVVSKRSDTAKVLTSLLGGFSTAVRAAVSPVTK